MQIIPKFREVLFLRSILNQHSKHSITLALELFHNSPWGPGLYSAWSPPFRLIKTSLTGLAIIIFFYCVKEMSAMTKRKLIYELSFLQKAVWWYVVLEYFQYYDVSAHKSQLQSHYCSSQHNFLVFVGKKIRWKL